MKTILLTGASGFVGGHLVKYISENYRDKYKLVLLTSKETDNQICICHKGYTFTAQDFKDKGVDRIDCLIHLGAFVGKTSKESASAINHYSSVAYTVHLLENLPNAPEKVIYISSVAVYGFNGALPYVPLNAPISEENEPVPRRNYALAKLFCERLVLEYAEKNQCVPQILRLGTVYGSERKQGYFLKWIMNSIKDKSAFHLSAHPSYKFNYIHVNDVCKFIVNSIDLKKYEEPINLVSSENLTSLEVCQLAKSIIPSFEYTVENCDQYFGLDNWFDSSKRQRLLGEETYDLKSGLKQCLELQ